MYQKITALIDRVKGDLEQWPTGTVPWFRGESPEDEQFLMSKIAKYTAAEENYLLQTFRRQAGGLHNTPPHKDTDKWLFLALPCFSLPLTCPFPPPKMASRADKLSDDWKIARAFSN